MLRVHHLSCGAYRPIGGRFTDGFSQGALGRLVRHCLLIETAQGLVMVDTGLNPRDAARPAARMGALWAGLLNPRVGPGETAAAQVRALGYDLADVRHVVLTHLDFDCDGGLVDFPHAAVHVTALEADAAVQREGELARRRYRPRQWEDVRGWRRYRADGGRWYGFDGVRELEGLPPEILLVPLPGHTWGHTGVAVRSDTGWLLHAGDAYFHHAELNGPKRDCPPGLRLYQNHMEIDRHARLANLTRLRALARDRRDDVRVFCGHDAVEFSQARRRERAQRLEAAPALIGLEDQPRVG